MKRLLLIAAALSASLAAPATLLAQDDTAARIATAAAGAAKGPGNVTLWKLLESGGWAMLPLGLMSILMVMLIFAYAITLRRGAVLSYSFMNTAEVLIKKRDYSGLLAIANRHGEAIARIVHRMLEFSSKNPNAPFEVVREIAQTEGAAQASSIQNRITYLADIAVLSPMVGLLGTVFGIIQSFGVLASATTQASRPVLLAQGVSEALVATGTGLIIGIISMAFYGYFRNKVQSLLSDLESASAHLLGLISFNGGYEPAQEATRPDYKIEPRRRTETTVEPPPPPRRPAVSIDDDF